MTTSDDTSPGDTPLTALLVLDQSGGRPADGFGLAPDPTAPDPTDRLLDVLAEYGFSCGPVVGGVCAVTAPSESIRALESRVAAMKAPDEYEQPDDDEFSFLLHAVVQDLVFDEPVETFDGSNHDTQTAAAATGDREGEREEAPDDHRESTDDGDDRDAGDTDIEPMV